MTESVTDAAEEAAKHKHFNIVVNGEPKTVDEKDVSYAQVVHLAYPVLPSPDTTFSVTYRKAAQQPHEGSLVEGQSVEVKKEGTIFNVKATGKS